jgi:hypothetical protein
MGTLVFSGRGNPVPITNSFDRFRGFARDSLDLLDKPLAIGDPARRMRGRTGMKNHEPKTRLKTAPGKLGWIFLWLIGIPIPILLILFLMRGCT